MNDNDTFSATCKECEGTFTSETPMSTCPECGVPFSPAAIRIEYDDDALQIMENVNKALAPHGLSFVDDDEAHDGFIVMELKGKKK